jgi:lipopolysaccharide biosynthesis protein
MKRTVCLYSSYVAGDGLPFYVRYYLKELTKHFDRLIYITNERVLNDDAMSFLAEHNIELLLVKNEGYDFGMWYKAMLKLEEEQKAPLDHAFDAVALINDSCILFTDLNKEFEKIRNSDAGYVGMIISDRYATHLQSFFLVIKGHAIKVLTDYFHGNGLVQDYREVIQRYEIGLTQEMIRNGVKIESLYNVSNRAYPKNPSFALVRELIGEGIPLIKKKIVFRNYRGLEYYWVVRMNFDTDYRKYFRLIREKYGNNTIDLKRVMEDAPRKGNLDLWLFAIARAFANFFRIIPGFRWLFHALVKFYKKYIRKA